MAALTAPLIAARIFTPSKHHRVIVESLSEYQDSPGDLSALYIRSGNRASVPVLLWNRYALLFVSIMVAHVVLGILCERHVHPITTFAGLLFSQLVTLFLTPVYYT
jgi:multidrug efflux pump subunit AcrB